VSTRKDEILALARTLFAERGYTSTSMRDLAEASGVLPGSLYAHFRSKADLARQIVMEFFVDLLPEQEKAYESEGSGAERYARMIDAVFAVCAKHHEAVRLLHYDWKVLSEMEMLEEMRVGTDRTMDLWRDAALEAVKDGTFGADIDPEYMVRLLASAINGMLDQSRFVGRPAPSSALSPAEFLKRSVLVGCTTPKGAAKVEHLVKPLPGARKPTKRKVPAKPSA
jgi:AcrR family transcriptional regulator